MVVKVVNEVDASFGDDPWRLYETAFRDLDAYAVQRHLLHPDEFAQVMADPRLDKYLALDEADQLVGLAVYTNELDAWPLVSPAYFARRWPVHFAQQRIWYCGFVAVPGHEPGVFVELVAAMYRWAAAQGGVIALDICRFNAETHRLPQAIRLLLRGISGGRVRAEDADAQTFWVYETAPDEVAA